MVALVRWPSLVQAVTAMCVCAHMYVCVCVYMYLYACICVYVMCVYMFLHVSLYICVHAVSCAPVYIYLYVCNVCIRTCMSVCMCVYTCVHMCICWGGDSVWEEWSDQLPCQVEDRLDRCGYTVYLSQLSSLPRILLLFCVPGSKQEDRAGAARLKMRFLSHEALGGVEPLREPQFLLCKFQWSLPALQERGLE